MKLNKKGFTLVELLAVVVILLAISVIAISSISAAIDRNNNKQNETKKEVIVNYAKLYYERHKNTLYNRAVKCITIDELMASDDLNISEDELKDVNDNRFVGGVRYDNEGNFTYDSTCS